MRLLHEIVIVAMETLGFLLASAGLGVLASWWFGLMGFLMGSGLGLLGFSTLAAFGLHMMAKPPQQQKQGVR
jgi:hypothetical protein